MVLLAEQLEERRDLEVGCVVVGERLGEVEDEVAVGAGKAQQALLRAVELVHDGLMPKLHERLGNLGLDFLLVERTDDGTLVARGLVLVFVDEHAIVKDDDLQFAHLSPVES